MENWFTPMKLKKLIRDYFTFSRNERRGITILLILIFLLGVANKVIFNFETPAQLDSAMLDSGKVKLGEYSDSIVSPPRILRFFPFDPNQIDSLALDSLALPAFVKKALVRYRNKGGKFRGPSDFKKIYGVTDSVYSRIMPFLEIHPLPEEPKSGILKPKLFTFDPNTASDEDFNRLGLTAKQISVIRNYQAKGGSFKNKNDFCRMYSLTEEQKRTLADFIQIKPVESKNADRKPNSGNLLIEINSADSTQLEKLPGIGVKLSSRIVKYRDLLGGFYSVSQLSEVYGLSEQTIHRLENKIQVDEHRVRKLDLNFSDVGELARHPYLKRDLAIRIIQFRTKYGNIRNPEVLRDSMILNIEEYKRLKPYL